jgi:hypothetical protein
MKLTNMSLKKFSLYILAVSLVISGCKKQLDQNDPDDISAGNAFETFEHIQYGVNGAYASYGAFANDMYISALVSDEAKIGFHNAGQGALTYRYQYSADGTTGGDVGGAYFPYYAMIDHINRILPEIDKVTATAAQEPLRAVVRGELLALRAMAHFNLMRIYSKNWDPNGLGIAVMTESDASARPARFTMALVMTQIENDLATAKTLVPAVTPATFTDVTMNKINVAAFQARVALYKKDWANAITYATEVISSNVRPLVGPTVYDDIWTDVVTNAEVLFRIRYSNSAAIGSMWTAGNLIYIAPSDKLSASFAPDDIRKPTFIDTTAAFPPPGNNVFVNKFYTSARGPRIVDMKAIRTAEIYLIRAEAYSQLAAPNLVAGAADLNAIRLIRQPSAVALVPATADDLKNAVLQERFKELCFEGHRLWDLKRNNLPVQRNASDASAGWQTLPANSFRFIMPIPQAATNANPNTQQNEGY